MLIRKMCNYHYYQQKERKIPINNFGYKKPNVKLDRKQRNDRLKIFFEYHLNKLQNGIYYCENCNSRLIGQIANIAHILPKRSNCNPEIMDNLDNYMYLCCSLYGEPGCHEFFDRNQGSSRIYKMPCFKIAHSRYKKIIDNGFKLKYNKYVAIFEDYIDG